MEVKGLLFILYGVNFFAALLWGWEVFSYIRNENLWRLKFVAGESLLLLLANMFEVGVIIYRHDWEVLQFWLGLNFCYALAGLGMGYCAHWLRSMFRRT